MRTKSPPVFYTLIACGLVLVLFASACTGSDPEEPATTNPAEQALAEVDTTIPTETTVAAPIGQGFQACRQVSAVSDGRVERLDLNEASGLAASRRHQGVVWAVNDSGNETGVHAIALDGSDRGFFRLVGVDGAAVDAVDIEDMAIHDGMLYLADIGDNRSRRNDGVTVYVVDEPVPRSGGAEDGNGTAVVRERVDLRYPDGPTDAEAFLVDPVTGQWMVLDKNLDDSQTRVFVAQPPFEEHEIELELTGTFDLAALRSEATDLIPSALLFPGAVTAADISEDGSLIAVRTYGTVWLFPRDTGTSGNAQTVSEALADVPCEGGATREGQGESLALLGSGAWVSTAGDNTEGNDTEGDPRQISYVTVSEGERRAVNVVTVEPEQ